MINIISENSKALKACVCIPGQIRVSVSTLSQYPEIRLFGPDDEDLTAKAFPELREGAAPTATARNLLRALSFAEASDNEGPRIPWTVLCAHGPVDNPTESDFQVHASFARSRTLTR